MFITIAENVYVAISNHTISDLSQDLVNQFYFLKTPMLIFDRTEHIYRTGLVVFC